MWRRELPGSEYLVEYVAWDPGHLSYWTSWVLSIHVLHVMISQKFAEDLLSLRIEAETARNGKGLTGRLTPLDAKQNDGFGKAPRYSLSCICWSSPIPGPGLDAEDVTDEDVTDTLDAVDTVDAVADNLEEGTSQRKLHSNPLLPQFSQAGRAPSHY